MGARTTLVVIAATSLISPSAWADREVKLEMTGLVVVIPDDWSLQRAAFSASDMFYRADGEEYLGAVELIAEPCGALMANNKAKLPAATDPVPEVISGWSDAAYVWMDGDHPIAVFCRDLGIDGQQGGAIVEGPPTMVAVLVGVVDAAIERALAALSAEEAPAEPDGVITTTTTTATDQPDSAWRPKSRPSPIQPFLPTRYELGFTRMTIDTGDALFNEQGWGATFAVERNLYGGGLPAWGYRARLSPTGAGLAGYLEGALGAANKGLAVMAVGGVGGAGSGAPFGVHGGVHAGIQLPNGIDLDGGYAWTADGSTRFQFEGRFFFRGDGPRAYSMGIGYESRGISSLFTIDVGIFFPKD